MNASVSMSAPTAWPGPTPWVRALGYGGLLPFAGLAVALWVLPAGQRALAASALAAYAALIASFLGGIHWGIGWIAGRAARAHFVWGVVPSLLAWPALLVPPAAGLPWLGVVLLACYGVDRRLYPPCGLAAWLGLRAQLSAVAVLACFAGAAAA